MKVMVDANTIHDAGFDKFLRRDVNMSRGYVKRYNSAVNLSSGRLPSDTVIRIGNIKIDGKNQRIVVNDGTDDRILIGYQSGGF